jgi:hypothetical protein
MMDVPLSTWSLFNSAGRHHHGSEAMCTATGSGTSPGGPSS